MTEKYSVYQHWDPLKVCLVGKSYSPKFYSFIKNPKVRTVFEQIAQETEEDYQKLIKLLQSFGVEIRRPDVSENWEECLYYLDKTKVKPPPMTPRDYSLSLGNNLFFKTWGLNKHWWQNFSDNIELMPKSLDDFNNLPEDMKKSIKKYNLDIEKFFSLNSSITFEEQNEWNSVLTHLSKNMNIYSSKVPQSFENFNSAQITRVGKDIYVGTNPDAGWTKEELLQRKFQWEKTFPEYRWHLVDSNGHSDGTFCPVIPGLIISLQDIPTYKDTFPDWEVVYLPGQSWSKVRSFLELKTKNYGKWWVPGEELNNDFTDFVEQWMNHWVGYVEETVFDVNMFVIDEKNVVCNNYNAKVFKALKNYGVTPHVINFRHRYFWDGGLHCITSDMHREGTMKDYFPERREI
jgi:hypothetical protein